MRSQVLLAVIAAIAATGCVVHEDGPISGNITVSWTFTDGDNCANVQSIEIDIPGEVQQKFNCSDGAELLTDNFAPGTYQVSVTGFDGSNHPIYQGTRAVTVNGNVSVTVAMSPVEPPAQPGNITVMWTFSDGDNCVGVDHIHIDIPGQSLVGGGDFACNSAGTQGATLTQLPAGTYSITVSALNAGGSIIYQGSTTAVVNGNVTATAELTAITVPPQNGNITVSWSFSDGDNCQNVNKIMIGIGNEFSQAFNCTDGQEVITNFNPGTYTIDVTATDASGTLIYQGSTNVTVNGDVSVSVVLNPYNPPQQGGAIVVGWTFSDADNCVGVDHIHIDVAGQTISPSDFSCADGSEILSNFNPGDYQVSVSALDSSGVVIYQGSSVATVNGNVDVQVVLSPTGQPGNITLMWSFPGGGTCASTGVDHVVVTIPGEDLGNGAGAGESYPCEAAGVQGVTITNFTAGTYSVSLSAEDPNNVQLFSGGGDVTVNGDVTATIPLN